MCAPASPVQNGAHGGTHRTFISSWRLKLGASLVLGCWGLGLSAAAQSTAFTYQGRLDDAGSPASGIYDLRFTIYDLSSGGSAVAGALTNSAVGITNGLFTVSLDFGAGVFTGSQRWLEIAVRHPGGGSFTGLGPRQPVTPTPYALYAESAGAGGGIWSLNGASAYYTGGNVGIGTANPTPGIQLEVNGAALLTPGGSGGNIQFGSPNAETGMTIIGGARADIRFDGATLKLLAGPVGVARRERGVETTTRSAGKNHSQPEFKLREAISFT